MKKLAKILIMVMLVALAISALAFSAFAEEEDTTVYTYGGFTVNDTAYLASNESGTTLAEAVAAATKGDVITLNNNIAVSENLAPKVNLTIDLNGKTLNSTADTLFDYATSSIKSLTLKLIGSGTVNCSQRFLYNGGGWKFYVTSDSATERITINANSTNLIVGNTISSISGTVELKNVDVVISTNLAASGTDASIFYNNKTLFTFDGCNVTSANSGAVSGTSYIFTAATSGGTDTTPHLYTFKNSTLDAPGSASRGFNVGKTASLVVSGSTVNMPVGIRMESSALSVKINNGSVFTSTSNIPLWLGNNNFEIDSSRITTSIANYGALYMVNNAAEGDVTVITNSVFENTGSGYAIMTAAGTNADATQKITNCTLKSNSKYTVLHQAASTLELENCKITASASHSLYTNNASVTELKNCELTTATGTGVYANGSSSISLDNCMINAATGFNINTTGAISLKETYMNATQHGFYFNTLTSSEGLTIDGCFIRSATGGGNHTMVTFTANAKILNANNAYIINAKNSTLINEGYNATTNNTAHFMLLNDSLTTGTITGLISFDNCTVTSAYRMIATNLDATNLTATNRLSFVFNDSDILQVNDGTSDSMFRGYGILMNFTGDTRIVHAKSSVNLSVGQTPVAGALNFAEGTRLSFAPTDVGFTTPEGCSLVYDPFGDAEAPYVVAKTEGFDGFINDKVFSVALGTSFGSYSVDEDGKGTYTSNVNMQIGFQHSEGSSMLANYESNGNTFVKYTLPTTSNSNVTVDSEAGTVNFVGTTDFFVMGSGTVAKAPVADFTVTHSDSTTYEAVAKKVIVLQMNFTAGSDTGYVPFNLQLAARGGSITNENSITAGSSSLGSTELINISGDNTFKAPDGNTYTLNGFHAWNNLYVVVDVANNKLHAYVNGACVTGDGITAMQSGAQYIQGFRINLKGKTVSESTDTIAFDGFAAVTYDDYVSETFDLDDYVKLSDAYKSIAPTSENIVAKGHAYGTVDAALSAVKGTDYTVRLHGDVNESQTVGTAGTVLTLDNALNLANTNTEKFIKYTRTTSGAFGDVYTFTYNKSLGTSVNLSLHSSFDINLFIPTELSSYVTKILANGADITADAYEFEEYLVASVGRASDEACDNVVYKVTFTENGKTYTYSFTVSIEAYAEKLLDGWTVDAATDTQVLMYYILDYANEANLYFNTDSALAEKVEALAALGEKLTVTDATATAVNTIDNTKFSGATVVLDETPSIRLVLKEATDAVITASYTDVKTGAVRYADVTVDGLNVDIDGVKIYNLAETLTVYIDGASVGQFNLGAYKASVTSADSHYALVAALCEYVSFSKYVYSAN